MRVRLRTRDHLGELGAFTHLYQINVFVDWFDCTIVIVLTDNVCKNKVTIFFNLTYWGKGVLSPLNNLITIMEKRHMKCEFKHYFNILYINFNYNNSMLFSKTI